MPQNDPADPRNEGEQRPNGGGPTRREEVQRRVKERTSQAAQTVRERAGEASQEARKRASEVDKKEAARQAARALAAAGEGDPRKAKDNRDVAKRAQEAANIRAPMGGSLRTVGDERVVEDMARASGTEGAGLLGGPMLDFSMGSEGAEAGAGIGFDPSFIAGGGVDVDGNSGADAGAADAAEESEGGAFDFDDPFGVTGGDDSGGEQL